MCTLYERIQYFCKMKGVSGSKMCIDLGLSKSTMSEMKAGRTKGVSVPTAQKIANYFGITVDELYGIKNDKKNSPSEESLTERESTILELFRRFPEVQQDSLVLMLQKFDNVPEDKRGSALETLRAFLQMLQTP